jgi:hypothetical protein
MRTTPQRGLIRLGTLRNSGLRGMSPNQDLSLRLVYNTWANKMKGKKKEKKKKRKKKKPVVGSSKKYKLAPFIISSPIVTRFFCPPDTPRINSFPTSVSWHPVSPNIFSNI